MHITRIKCHAGQQAAARRHGLLLVPIAAGTISKSNVPLGWTVEKMYSLGNLMKEDTGIVSGHCHASLLS